jgi:hypothetical protein
LNTGPWFRQPDDFRSNTCEIYLDRFRGFFLLNAIVNAGLTSRGDTKSYRNVLFIGMILNIGLDPLFLFGFAPLGIPAMGAAGIALATVVVQGVSLAYMVLRARRARSCAGMRFRDYLPQRSFFREIAAQGIPASLNMMTVALGMFVINFFIARNGSTEGLAAYGVALRIEQIALLPSAGLHTAMLTLVGNNFGAHANLNGSRKRTGQRCCMDWSSWRYRLVSSCPSQGFSCDSSPPIRLSLQWGGGICTSKG